MKKSYLIILLGFINLLFAAGKIMESYELKKYSGGYGFKFSTSFDYIIWLISAVIIIAIGFIIKKEEDRQSKIEK